MPAALAWSKCLIVMTVQSICVSIFSTFIPFRYPVRQKVLVKVLAAQLCLTLCNPMDCSPPGSSVHGILQVRILEWVAIPFPRGSSHPRYQNQVSCISGRFFTIWATRKDGRRSRKKKYRDTKRESDLPKVWHNWAINTLTNTFCLTGYLKGINVEKIDTHMLWTVKIQYKCNSYCFVLHLLLAFVGWTPWGMALNLNWYRTSSTDPRSLELRRGDGGGISKGGNRAPMSHRPTTSLTSLSMSLSSVPHL